jgi:hypothetical protein
LSILKADLPAQTRRAFIRTAAGAVALGGYTHFPAGFTGLDSTTKLDDLSRNLRGRLLRRNSPTYDETRRVWNLAYDRRPLAMVRAVGLDDVRRCVEFAHTHAVPISIRGGGHSYAGYGVANGALQIDMGMFSNVSRTRYLRLSA